MEDPDWPLVKLRVTAADRAYLDSRAVAFNGNRSQAIRQIIHDSQRLRHDLRGQVTTLDLIDRCLETGGASSEEARGWIKQLRGELAALAADDGAAAP